MALDRLTKVDGGGISTTSDYRVGIITASKFVGPFDGTGGNFSGVVTATNGVFSGNVTIGGTLTYEDVTNIDSVGIITARDGLKVLGGGANIVVVVSATGADINGDLDVDGHTNLDNVSVAGVSTFVGVSTFNNQIFTNEISNSGIITSNTIHITGGTYKTETDVGIVMRDGQKIYAMEGGFLRNLIGHNTSDNSIQIGQFYTGIIDDIHLKPGTNGHIILHDGTTSSSNEKLRTVGSGITVFGNTETQTLNVTGVSTFTGAIDANGTLDVDGHTNLDNLSVAGVTTISDALHIESTQPRIYLTDTNHNSDWSIRNSDGTIYFYDETLTNTRFEIYPGNSPTTRPFIATPFTTDCRFDGFVRIGAVGNSPNHSLTVGGNSNFSGISSFIDIDVDGHTNLDNVNIAGVTTTSGNISVAKSSGIANISVTSGDNYATLEIGGQSGAFLDLKSPFSDDYDIRSVSYTHLTLPTIYSV